MFFSNNRKSSISTIEVEEAVGYEGVMGAQIAMYESVQNDYKLFEGALMGDFHEASMIHEGQSEEAIVAFQEGVISDMWNKLVEMFKKLWAKIKAVFHAFIAKFNSVFMKSSKEFINKYKKEIAAKNLSKMKAKYAKKKAKYDSLTKIAGKGISVIVNNESEAEKQLEDFETEEETLKAINDMTGEKFSDLKSFAKDFHEECFEDEEEEEGFDSIKYEVFTLLENSDKTESDLKKAQSNLEKHISDIIKEIEKASKANIKDYPTDASGADKEEDVATAYTAGGLTKEKVFASSNRKVQRKNVQSVLNLAQKKAQCVQSAINKLTAAVMAEHKFNVAQARRIAAKMVAYNPKAKNESVMLNAVEEVAFFEAMDELK